MKPIEGYENYLISSDGKVYSLKRKKFIYLHKTKRGYVSAAIYKNGKQQTFVVHRLVAKAFIPNPNNYPNVNHLDNCPWNNDVSNLEWCNQSMNLKHASNQGRLNPRSHLNLKSNK